jgi:hypothetical protein
MDNQIGLTPPWYTYFNEIKYTIGDDPNVNVGPELIPIVDGTCYSTPVFVEDTEEKALALATILKPIQEFGGVNVSVLVFFQCSIVQPSNQPLDADGVKNLFDTALQTNNLYSSTQVRPFMPGQAEAVYPIFDASVIQFFNDDLTDYYNNYNNVAAFTF